MVHGLITDAMWRNMFELGAPLVEKLLRPCIVYVALILLLRVFGKRELAQLNQFDLVVLMVLSQTVQNAMIGQDNSISGGIIGALALLALNYMVVRFLFHHHRLDQAIEGRSKILVTHGRISKRALDQELLSESELRSALRKQGFDNLDDVESCTLEPGGGFSVVRKQPASSQVQHDELLRHIDELRGKLDLLLARQNG